MSVLKRVVLAVGCTFAIGLATAGMAQTAGDKNKSAEAAAIGEGEVIMVHPKGAVHKSNLKVSTAKHEAAMKKGAREIASGTVLYKQGGKLYMMESSDHFRDHFDQPYQGGPKSN
jgi:hypothetical protein